VRLVRNMSTRPEYINRKGYPSMVLQGCCDATGQFTSVSCRYPGSVHDARVFRTSDLKLHEAKLIPAGYRLLGDSAYALTKTMLTPYKNFDPATDRKSRKFNYVHNATRIVIEHAFGRLKARWKRLKALDMRLEHAPDWIVAACVLHNWCEQQGDKWSIMSWDDPDEQHDKLNESIAEQAAAGDGDAIRDALREQIWKSDPVDAPAASVYRDDLQYL
jgi:hypothetical protein